jgi:hypothetical protein
MSAVAREPGDRDVFELCAPKGPLGGLPTSALPGLLPNGQEDILVDYAGPFVRQAVAEQVIAEYQRGVALQQARDEEFEAAMRLYWERMQRAIAPAGQAAYDEIMAMAGGPTFHSGRGPGGEPLGQPVAAPAVVQQRAEQARREALWAASEQYQTENPPPARDAFPRPSTLAKLKAALR